jgi:hypothetical protein
MRKMIKSLAYCSSFWSRTKHHNMKNLLLVLLVGLLCQSPLAEDVSPPAGFS